MSRSLDYDAFQPFSFSAPELEEEFYEGPNAPFWKKFELPTPPRSPQHEPVYPTKSNPTLDSLQMVSDILDNESFFSEMTEMSNMDVDSLLQSPLGSTTSSLGGFPDDVDLTEECDISCTCMRCVPADKFLIQDCMWSGRVLPPELKSPPNLTSNKPNSLLRSTSVCSTDSNRSRSSLSESDGMNITSAECVDPTAVFPFSVNDICRPRPAMTTPNSPTTMSLLRPDSLGAETPSDSGEFHELKTAWIFFFRPQIVHVTTKTWNLRANKHCQYFVSFRVAHLANWTLEKAKIAMSSWHLE